MCFSEGYWLEMLYKTVFCRDDHNTKGSAAIYATTVLWIHCTDLILASNDGLKLITILTALLEYLDF